MSTLALAVVALVLLIGPALVVIVLDASDIWGTESYTISTRDLPNTAPDLTGTADPRQNDRTRARRHDHDRGPAPLRRDDRHPPRRGDPGRSVPQRTLSGTPLCAPPRTSAPSPPPTGSSPSPASSRCSPCSPGPVTGPPPP